MIRPDGGRQGKREFIRIEEMAPDDHLLRKIDTYMDFGCVKERLYPVYRPDNGRPAVDPVVLFNMLFIGHLYGIRSARQLGRDSEVNVAYRWFSGVGPGDTVPHASTISRNRRRRFDGPSEKESKESTTDLESGYRTREGTPQGLYYLDHPTCDGRHNFITDVHHVTPANIHDSPVYLDRPDYRRKRFGFDVLEVGPDAGDNTPDICPGYPPLPYVPLCGRITPPRGLLLLQISPRLLSRISIIKLC